MATGSMYVPSAASQFGGYPVKSTQTAPSTLGSTAGSMLTGSSGPLLPQILQPLPDPTLLASQFSGLPGATASGPSFLDQSRQIISGLPQAPVITAPTVAPVTVAFPEGGYDQLRASLYESQMAPVRRELTRREAQERSQLNAQLAQTGLADSGVGVGQNQKLSREVGEQMGAASDRISESATARALEAQLAVATQQANIDIQRNLANANMDFAAQQVNARNILERGAFEANAYLTALGMDAARADNVRAQFLSFLDTQTKAALGQSEIARAALADIFGAVLQSEAAGLRTQELQETIRANKAREGLERSSLDQQALLQGRQLDLQGRQVETQERTAEAERAAAFLNAQAAQANTRWSIGAMTDQYGFPMNDIARDQQRAYATLLGR